MLTKQDLNSIGTIVRTELVPVRKDINKLQVDVKKLRKDLDKTIDFKTRTELGLNEVAFAY